MRKLMIVFALLMFACNEEVTTEDIFSEFAVTPESIPADGQSIVEVSVRLNEKSSADRRNVVFKTTSGTFTTSGKSEQTVKASYVDGKLIAKGRLRAPITNGNFKVSVEPEFNSPVDTYSLEKEVATSMSVPAKIILQQSATGIFANGGSEVKITGVLLNESNKWVTKGVAVEFQDVIGSTSAGGYFRNAATTSSDTSTVVAYYAAGNHPSGTVIDITVKTKDTNIVSNTIKLIISPQ